MNHTLLKAIKLISADMAELTQASNETKKEIFLGMGFALGRIYEAETGNDMRTIGPIRILQWARDEANRR